MAGLIDTSVLVALERGQVSVEELGEGPHAISVISVSEMLHGFHRAKPEVRTRRGLVVERILARFESLAITEEIARVHADVGAHLAVAGTPVAVNDLWIGATALLHGLSVATRDHRSFSRIPGLELIAV